MNQLSAIGFSTDANVLAGFAQSAGDRLGNIDLIFENRGNVAAFIKVSQFDGVTSPSGYAQIGAGSTVAAGGSLTRSFNLLSKRIGFFGSGVGGSTSVNISAVIRNKGDLRGAQIDIVATGRKGWGYDSGFNRPDLTKKWGSVVGVTTSGGVIDAGQGNFRNDEGV